MSALRGFGFQLDTQTGRIRNWYVDGDGVQRWADDDMPCPGQILKGNADLVPAEHQTFGGES